MVDNKDYTKQELTEICQEILYQSDTIVNKKNSRFLIENVLCNHPDWFTKRGCGIDHIEVRKNKYGQKCFYIVRSDGTDTDISFTKSISNPNNITILMRACRSAIRPLIIKFKEDTIKLPFTCPITGEVINEHHLVHVDHYDLTFEELFYKWLKDKNVDDLYKKTLESKRDGYIGTEFNDPNVIANFIDFHNNNTHLRLVSRTANLSTLKKSIMS